MIDSTTVRPEVSKGQCTPGLRYLSPNGVVFRVMKAPIGTLETQAEVSKALEALHTKAARLALRLEEGGALLLPEAQSLLDDIDALRALHLRVVMRLPAPV